MKELLTEFILFAANSAGSHVTWGGLFQPKKPDSLKKKMICT